MLDVGIRKRQERSKLGKGLVMLPGAKLKSLNLLPKLYRGSDGFKQESDCTGFHFKKTMFACVRGWKAGVIRIQEAGLAVTAGVR